MRGGTGACPDGGDAEKRPRQLSQDHHHRLSDKSDETHAVVCRVLIKDKFAVVGCLRVIVFLRGTICVSVQGRGICQQQQQRRPGRRVAASYGDRHGGDTADLRSCERAVSRWQTLAMVRRALIRRGGQTGTAEWGMEGLCMGEGMVDVGGRPWSLAEQPGDKKDGKGNSGGLLAAAGRAATGPTVGSGSRGGAPPPAALATPPCRAERHSGKRCGHQPVCSREGTGVGATREQHGVVGESAAAAGDDRGGDLHGTAAAVRVRVPTGGESGCRSRVREARQAECARCDAVARVAEGRRRRERGAGGGTARRRFPSAWWGAPHTSCTCVGQRGL